MLYKELEKLGLSEKEARVYLASLELGPSPVQNISQKSKVNRATTYVVIDNLLDMGLMSTYSEGKKTFFIAEKPERLLEYLKNEEMRLQNKINILQDKLPEIRSLYNNQNGKPKVRYYEGIEGLRAVQMDFAETLKNGEEILTLLPYDDFVTSHLVEKFENNKKNRIAKGIRVKVIYTSKKGRQKKYEDASLKNLRETLFVPYKDYPIRGGMNIYGNKVFMIDYLGSMGGLVIENKTLANMMSQLFMLAWNNIKKEKKSVPLSLLS